MTDAIQLREVTDDDLPIFFEQQLDPDAIHMAAFTAENPADRIAFEAHWGRIRTSDSVILRTILSGEDVAGYVGSFERDGDREVTYWIGKEYWGQGVATRALLAFLECVKVRPLHARAAKDNVASLRVLEKCGFVITGQDKGFSNARGEEVEELILTLTSDDQAEAP